MNRGLGKNGHGGLTQDVSPTLSPNPSPSRERGTVDPIEMIAEGRHSVEAICRETKMSILELAAHVCTAQNLETLARVKQLHAIEREMLLGQLKRKALLRLAELTDEVAAGSADEIRASEVMRKACADLLRNWESGSRTRSNPSGPGGGGPRGYPGGGYQPEPLTPAFEAEVLEALERLGAEEKECPQIEDSPGRITQIAQTKWEDNENEYGYEPRAQASGSVPPESPSSPETVNIRTGKMPVPPESFPPQEMASRQVVLPPSEVRSSFHMQSCEKPRRSGQAGAYASGSLSNDPIHQPRPPPEPTPPKQPHRNIPLP